MRIDGTLAKWNDDRGFGFITPDQGGPDVFVHISAFPKDGRRPTLGERLTFEIEIASDGKKRAKGLLCPSRPAAHLARPSVPRRRSESQGIFGRAILLVLVVLLAAYGYGKYSRRVAPQAAVAAPSVQPVIPAPFDQPAVAAPPKQPAVAVPSSDQAASSSFHCDGRTYCSQMTSCAEATFFLKNCPGVKMDGNHDGVPCEQQWCTSAFAK